MLKFREKRIQECLKGLLKQIKIATANLQNRGQYDNAYQVLVTTTDTYAEQSLRLIITVVVFSGA